MAKPVDITGELLLTAEGGEQLGVAGSGSVIAVNLPSLATGRALSRQAAGRTRRQQLIGKLQILLRHADLTLQFQIAGETVAKLSPRSRATVLSRLLGLGAVKLKPLALLRSVLKGVRN